MAAPLSRPLVRARTSALRLALSIAFGVWSGLLMAGLTGWLIARWAGVAPLTIAVTASPPATLAPPPARQPVNAPAAAGGTMPVAPPSRDGIPDGIPDGMFDQYQRNLQALDLRQLEEAARANPANQNNPKCQFWLEQARTAPTPNSRENIARFCAP
jgi:hypothetical protein